MKKLNKDLFIEKARKIHGDKYDYSLVDYVNSKTKVKIICQKHGVFEQTPNSHLKGRKCPLCAKEIRIQKRRDTLEIFLEKAKKIHGNKYDYSLVNYVNSRTKIKIICPKHGIFEKTPNRFLLGEGCPKCKLEEKKKKQTLTTEIFIDKAKEIHDNKYDYSRVNYKYSKLPVEIICKKHNKSFFQTPNNHLRGEGCPFCNNSKFEEEFAAFLSSVGVFYIRNTRKIIKPFELDFYLPDYKLAFELNGSFWHSCGIEYFEDRKFCEERHLKKQILCEEAGIHLIQFFDFEWYQKKEKLKNLIRAKFGFYDEVIYARNCHVKSISSEIYRCFCDKFHLQGSVPSSLKKGLFFKDKLVAVMGIGRRGIFTNDFELLRYCVFPGIKIVGGFSKLLKSFDVDKLISFGDRRFVFKHDNVYLRNGFTLIGETKPSYFYLTPQKGILTRYEAQKKKLKNLVGETIANKGTEKEILLKHGFRIIFDVGQLKYVWGE